MTLFWNFAPLYLSIQCTVGRGGTEQLWIKLVISQLTDIISTWNFQGQLYNFYCKFGLWYFLLNVDWFPIKWYFRKGASKKENLNWFRYFRCVLRTFYKILYLTGPSFFSYNFKDGKYVAYLYQIVFCIIYNYFTNIKIWKWEWHIYYN